MRTQIKVAVENTINFIDSGYSHVLAQEDYLWMEYKGYVNWIIFGVVLIYILYHTDGIAPDSNGLNTFLIMIFYVFYLRVCGNEKL